MGVRCCGRPMWWASDVAQQTVTLNNERPRKDRRHSVQTSPVTRGCRHTSHPGISSLFPGVFPTTLSPVWSSRETGDTTTDVLTAETTGSVRGVARLCSPSLGFVPSLRRRPFLRVRRAGKGYLACPCSLHGHLQDVVG